MYRVEIEEIFCPRCCSSMINYGDWQVCPACEFMDGDIPANIIEYHKYVYGGADIREEMK